MIKYHNAKDADGNIISIDNAIKGGQYFCIGCGKEMIAKKGPRKEHHFAHKHLVDCNVETYLHRYAKYLIKYLFDSQKKLVIKYHGELVCNQEDQCLFVKHQKEYDSYRHGDYHCRKEKLFSFDLKKYYNTCELEREYNGYVADVLLSNSTNPNRQPLFIEIAVTHPCSEEKIKSGIRIIEISIPKDSDNLESLSSLEETQQVESNKKRIEIVFNNFKKEEQSINPLSYNSFTIFFKNSNGKGQHKQIKRGCSFYGKHRLMPEAPLEIHFVEKYEAHSIGIAISNFVNNPIRDCKLCKYHGLRHFKTWYGYDKHSCNKNKEIKETSDANECKEYDFVPSKAKQIIEKSNNKYVVFH